MTEPERQRPGSEKSDLVRKALRLNKEGKKIRTPQIKDEEVNYLGESVGRRKVQKELNQKTAAERVTDLTANRRIEVIQALEDARHLEDKENGCALYQEYRETINPDFIDENEDFFEAWWISSKYLNELHRQKSESDFWESESNKKD